MQAPWGRFGPSTYFPFCFFGNHIRCCFMSTYYSCCCCCCCCCCCSWSLASN